MRNYILALAALFMLIYSCANPGYPTGGPKDESVPVVKKSTPPANALNYKEDKVIIEFDEIIKLKDVNQKFVVSPPLKKRPKIEARANKLSVRFDEDEVLQDNATYTLDFADAITDNNEGNALESFVFSFSTGEVVDSFAILGNVWEALDLAPIEGAIVLAHKNLNDTAFTHDIPVRLAKTDNTGHFALRNLSPGEYRVYAIEDGNRNYMFDQPGEHIAWIDTIISPSMEYVEMPDSITPDSVVFREELVYSPNDLKLFMFKEEETEQYSMGEERKDSNTMAFYFNLPLEEFNIEPITETPVTEDWAILEPSSKNDTMFIWITDSALYRRDTLKMAYSYMGLDTLDNPALINDTVRMYHFKLPPQRETRRSKKKKKKVVPTLQMGKSSSGVDVYGSFNFIMPTPIKSFNQEGMQLFEQVDTLMEKRDYTFVQDSAFKRRYSVKTKWTPGAKYTLVIDSASIEDVYGLKCDSIGKQFTVKDLDSYGMILLNIGHGGDEWLIQLLNNSDEIIRQKYVPTSGKLAFQNLNPGAYKIKLVMDKNMNEKWDTGNYELKIQPEQVFYYPGKIDLRATWDHVVEWKLEEFDIYDFVEKNRKPKKREEN
ncbi:Ig-like domain-containing protein [Labilibacter marinus]|uniref:Ig-like domain-containing protein n=1 Tax=Labilibacter marinus TaxID=1477105 RepID=UPI00082CA033|nr:Ig-like domain-containing protein [Labilibacter marinus]